MQSDEHKMGNEPFKESYSDVIEIGMRAKVSGGKKARHAIGGYTKGEGRDGVILEWHLMLYYPCCFFLSTDF